MGFEAQGQRLEDDSFLLFFNAQADSQDFCVPPLLKNQSWSMVINTEKPVGFVNDRHIYKPGEAIAVADFSLIVLTSPKPTVG
jgi:isoamylase